MHARLSRYLPSLSGLLLLLPFTALGQLITIDQLSTGTTEPQTVVTTIPESADPAGHSCCVIAPPSEMEIFMLEGELVIQEPGGGNSVPWLDFDPMAIDSNLQFTGQNRATVAGFNNILTVISGSITGNSISADVTIGADGGLPSGQPLQYSFFFEPGLKNEWDFANFVSMHAEVGFVFSLIDTTQDFERRIWPAPPLTTEGLELFVTMDVEGVEGDGDWWLVMMSDQGELFSFDATTGRFEPGLKTTHQGLLVDVPEHISVIKDLTLPSDNTTIVFGVDLNPNNELDLDSLYGTARVYYFN